MNCVIIEDEKAGQEIIKLKLSHFFPDITVLKILDNVKESIQFLSKSEKYIDFIFLDVQLKDGTAFEILEAIKNPSFKIIFITAFEQFAINAFEHNASHYLLKPFKDSAFLDAIHRIYNPKKNTFNNKITLNFKNEFNLVDLNEIIFIKSEGTYSEINCLSKKFVYSKNLGFIESKLNSDFIRIHHSYLVNKNHIKKFENNRNALVHLTNEHILPISQRKKQEVYNLLKI